MYSTFQCQLTNQAFKNRPHGERSVIVPSHRTIFGTLLPKNWRGITLLNMVNKIMVNKYGIINWKIKVNKNGTWLINKRLSNYISPRLRIE